MSERTSSKRKRHENGESSKSKVKPDPERVKEVKPDPERVKEVKPESVKLHSELVKKEEFSDDDETPNVQVKVESNPGQSRECPYLDTIDRNVLDFGN
jgi:hypothetical protein